MFPLFTIFILFLGWFTYNRLRAVKIEKKRDEEYWQREVEANNVRRKDISHLPYLIISVETLPFGVSPQDETLCRIEQEILNLRDKKIINSSHYTSTQLKLEYGAANLPFLTECEEHYTKLIRSMHQWGVRLYELSFYPQAEIVLSQAIQWGSDIKGSYLLLAKIHQQNGNYQGIAKLKEQAESLNSLMKNPILKALKDF